MGTDRKEGLCQGKITEAETPTGTVKYQNKQEKKFKINETEKEEKWRKKSQ